MQLTYQHAQSPDIQVIYTFAKELIDLYEDKSQINQAKVLTWVHQKIENHIQEYTCIFVDGKKVGYYRFSPFDETRMELDDLYIFPSYRGRGIGTTVIQKCCAETKQPILLYAFQKNKRALALYQRLGFRIQYQTSSVSNTRYILQKN